VLGDELLEQLVAHFVAQTGANRIPVSPAHGPLAERSERQGQGGRTGQRHERPPRRRLGLRGAHLSASLFRLHRGNRARAQAARRPDLHGVPERSPRCTVELDPLSTWRALRDVLLDLEKQRRLELTIEISLQHPHVISAPAPLRRHELRPVHAAPRFLVR
jgi:hypothetical protein